MNIVSIYYTHKPGGFCKRLYRLLSALAVRGHRVTYFCLDQPPEPLSHKVIFHKIPFPLKRRKGLFFWALFTLWTPVYFALSGYKKSPEKIIVFGAYYSSMSFFLALLSRAPTVLFLRSLVFKIDEITEKPFLIRKIAAAVERFGISRADTLVCMTRAMQAELESFMGKTLKTEILPNEVPELVHSSSPVPADLQEFMHRNEDGILLLTSGVLDQRKNVSFLIDVLRRLQNPELALIVAGDGPLLADLQQQSEGLNIFYAGWVANLPALFSSISLVVHPSLHEGIPNSVLEPLAAGLPVLASDIPEHRELLQDDRLLFSLSSNADLHKKLRKLDQYLLSELRSLCEERADAFRFDWDSRACELALT